MPKRRDQIRMSDEEVRDFIAASKSLQVATIGPDGAPHLTTLWFALVDGRIVFETYSKSQKIVNLKRDPRMAVLLEDGTEYDQLRGVSMNGTAELVSDPRAVKRLAAGVLTRNQPGFSREQAEAAVEHMAAKRTAVVFHPEKVVSWDHRKLGGSD